VFGISKAQSTSTQNTQYFSGSRFSRVGKDHSPEAVARRLSEPPKQVYVKDFVYGGIDGSVTTFAVVSGVAGAGLSSVVIIVLGLSNIIADGFSMAISNYLGTKAENQYVEQERKEELEEIKANPEGEREEIRQIYAKKGFTGDALEHIVTVISSDREQWIDTMIIEEHGLSLEPTNAGTAALVTFSAFLGLGLLPLLPFLINWWKADAFSHPFFISTCITMLAFFVVGAFKGRFVKHSWYRSGLETFCVGGAAALLAYGVGLMLRGLVP